MITTLHIRNIGIIEDIEIDFNKGFNVLTGETGAGKSLIINSINMICGGRFSKEMIRKGEEKSSVEVCLFLPELKQEFNEEYIIVSREVHTSGKNLCKINGRMVTVGELKNFMSNIVDIHGQFDSQNLMDSKKHIEFLDDFCGESLTCYLNEYKKMYIEYNKIKSELAKNFGNDIERQRKLDLLRYQLNEIQEASLKENEEVELEEKKKVMLNFEKISEALENATFKIENNILLEIENILRPLEKIESLDLRYSEKAQSIRNTYYEFEEHLRDLSDYKNELEFDEEDFKNTQERLDLIFNLKRKYGNSISDILEYKNSLEEEIEKIENLEEYNNSLKTRLNKLKTSMLEIAKKADVIRKEQVKILEKSINNELVSLEMPNAKLKVNITFNEEMEFKENGLNNVEFLITTNVGEEFKPLDKIASGGEISRIMLAMKTVFADVDKVKTIIFDEIDTGISGSAVKKVAEKIKKISALRQVLAVTHQPILAASADYNYQIRKKVKNEKTTSTIKLLNEEETVEEIAKISNGTLTTIALKHALELRNACI